jgi:hypothetical protein
MSYIYGALCKARNLNVLYIWTCGSQWPHSLRRRSTAARLLRSWVWIPPGAWMFVCCVCCQVDVSATSLSLVQGNPTDHARRCVWSRNLVIRGDHSPHWAAEPEIIINNIWTYVWQRWMPSLSICCTMFQHSISAESYPVAQLCVNTLPATKVTLITDGI